VLQGALLPPDSRRERRDAAELSAHARREDQSKRIALGRDRAAEDEIACLEERALISELGRPVGGERLPGQHREVHFERALEQAGVRRDPVARCEDEHIARDEAPGVYLTPAAVPHDRRPGRQVLLQSLHRPLGLLLLDEREHRVEHDHGDDRDSDRRRDRDERERRRNPQEKGKRMRELSSELPRPLPADASAQLVRAVDDEPPLRLAAREPAFRSLEMTKQHRQRSARIASAIFADGMLVVHEALAFSTAAAGARGTGGRLAGLRCSPQLTTRSRPRRRRGDASDAAR
jgi:hypothetical protein